MATHKPIAVLLVRTSDKTSTPEFTVKDYEDFFLNDPESMNQYWSDVSDGAIDLNGTRVFDWRKLSVNSEAFLRLGRAGKIQAAVDAFANAPEASKRVDLSGFDSIAVFADPAGEFGSIGRVSFNLQGTARIMGAAIFTPAIQHRELAHEIGHGFGFDHSFNDSPVPIDPANDGRPGAYGDLWDIMSVNNVRSYGHPRYGWAGPGLNTVMRDLAGWLNPARIISWPEGAGTVTIHDINDRAPGRKHVLKIAEFHFELRVNRGWDRGIFMSSVQVRSRAFNVYEHSKVLRIPTMNIGRIQPARYEMGVGDGFETGDPHNDFKRYLRVIVQSIDIAAGSATLAVEYRLARPVPSAGPAITLTGGLEADGGGWIIVGGHLHRVPPHNPLANLLPGLGTLASAEQIEDSKLRQQVVKSAVSQLVARLREVTPKKE